jgi:hypothetical protein
MKVGILFDADVKNGGSYQMSVNNLIATKYVLEEKNIDLVISNYAFSECDVKIQEFYYNTVISNAKYFYMVYNNITPYNMNWEKFKTYASKDFNIHIEEEIRSTHTNYIFYGTKK